LVAKNGKDNAIKCFGYLERTKDIISFIENNNKPIVVNNQ
jgi:hypothetical protein